MWPLLFLIKHLNLEPKMLKTKIEPDIIILS